MYNFWTLSVTHDHDIERHKDSVFPPPNHFNVRQEREHAPTRKITSNKSIHPFGRPVNLIRAEAVTEGNGHVRPLAKEWQTAPRRVGTGSQIDSYRASEDVRVRWRAEEVPQARADN